MYALNAAVSAVVIVANFLSVLQILIPSLLSTSAHERAAVTTRHGSEQEDPALCMYTSKEDHLCLESSHLFG